MTAFHTDEYIDFLSKVTPETFDELSFGGQRCEDFTPFFTFFCLNDVCLSYTLQS